MTASYAYAMQAKQIINNQMDLALLWNKWNVWCVSSYSKIKRSTDLWREVILHNSIRLDNYDDINDLIEQIYPYEIEFHPIKCNLIKSWQIWDKF
jgi:hypothetical protein